MLKTSCNLSSDVLSEFGIEEVSVSVHIERVPGESYHKAVDVEIDEVTGNRDGLIDAAIEKGYNVPETFLYNEFRHILDEVAMSDGPGLESDRAYDRYRSLL